MQWIVQYKIENAHNWLFNVESRETIIRDISQSVMNKLVGDLPILSVMTSQRTRIEVEAQENMQALRLLRPGVRVITVKRRTSSRRSVRSRTPSRTSTRPSRT